MKGAATMILVAVIAAYFVIFIVSKRRIGSDNFINLPVLKPGSDIPVEQNASVNPYGKPYTTIPIMDVGDYDQDVVYQNEGDRQWSKAEINKMTAAYPFAWPQLPPSATTFQAKQEAYMASLQSKLLPDVAQYEAVEGFQVLPTDTAAQEAEEQKLLQTYVPACSKDLKYDVDDAMELIKKIYDKKGEVAKVDVRPDGIYEVYEVQEKDPKIVYEDQVQATTERQSAAAAQAVTFQVPQYAADLASGLDPFFEPGPRLRSDRTDYTQWTPGLERMFAPTYPRTNWF
jgi:hypothetical protein